LKIQLDLKFEGTNPESIILAGFLPETKADGIHMNLMAGRYGVVIYMSDRQKQKGNVIDLPADLEELKKHMTLMCRGLTVEIEDTNPNIKVLEDLKARIATEDTEKYAHEIVNLGIQIHNGIVEYFRNFANQIWLEEINVNSNLQKTLKFLVSEFNAMCLDVNNEWRPFALVVNEPGIKMSFRNNFGRSVTKDEWNQIPAFVEGFIENHKRAPLHKVLLANSHQHLDNLDGRLATVEAVIALESALKQLLSKVLFNTPGFPGMKQKALEGLIKEAGLQLSVKAVLKTISSSVGLNDNEIDTVSRAIAERNLILHQRMRDLEVSKARKYIDTIEKVVSILVHRADSANAAVL
jgi:hypothetical protein